MQEGSKVMHDFLAWNERGPENKASSIRDRCRTYQPLSAAAPWSVLGW